MQFVKSKDGTNIAYEKTGKGPALILSVGAFNDSATAAPLAAVLSGKFTVYNYDRRGRGRSGNTLPYSPEREIEDIEALIGEAGGSACLFGYSSGAALSMLAAEQSRLNSRGKNTGGQAVIAKLAVYEVPLVVAAQGPADGASDTRSDSKAVLSSTDGRTIEIDEKQPRFRHGLADELSALLAKGRRGEAVELFQTKAVGIPEEIVIQMRRAPFRPALENMAHTLEYEMRIIESISAPLKLAAAIAIPALFAAGGDSPAFMREGATALAKGAPKGRSTILAGQNHDMVAEVLGPVLAEFFES